MSDNQKNAEGDGAGNSASEILAQAAIAGVSALTVFFTVSLGRPGPIAFAALTVAMAATAYLLSIARRGLPAGFPLPVVAFLAFPLSVAVSAWSNPAAAPEAPERVAEARATPPPSYPPEKTPSARDAITSETPIETSLLEADRALINHNRDGAMVILEKSLVKIDAMTPPDTVLRSVVLSKILGLTSGSKDKGPSLQLIDAHVKKLEGGSGGDPRMKIEWLDRAGRLAGDMGQLESSLGYFEEALGLMEAHKEPDPGPRAIMSLNIAVTLDRLGRKEEAAAVLEKAIPQMDLLPTDHPARIQAAKMLQVLKGGPAAPPVVP